MSKPRLVMVGRCSFCGGWLFRRGGDSGQPAVNRDDVEHSHVEPWRVIPAQHAQTDG